MKTFDSFQSLPTFNTNTAISIGIFDGIHIGHQMIIKELHKKAGKNNKGLITFNQRPAAYFNPLEADLPIMSVEHRLHLLEQYGLDFVLCLSFNHEIADMSYEDFLLRLKEKLNFTHLILGKNATFGKDRLGNEQTVLPFAKKEGFEAEFLHKLTLQNEIVSSTKIRKQVIDGDFKKLKKSLGRRYSLLISHFNPEITEKKGNWFTFAHTFNNLLSLPSGTYSISLVNQGETITGFALVTNKAKHTPSGFVLDVFFKNNQLLKGPLTVVFIDKSPPRPKHEMLQAFKESPSSSLILQTSMKNITIKDN